MDNNEVVLGCGGERTPNIAGVVVMLGEKEVFNSALACCNVDGRVDEVC